MNDHEFKTTNAEAHIEQSIEGREAAKRYVRVILLNHKIGMARVKIERAHSYANKQITHHHPSYWSGKVQAYEEALHAIKRLVAVTEGA